MTVLYLIPESNKYKVKNRSYHSLHFCVTCDVIDSEWNDTTVILEQKNYLIVRAINCI